MTKNTLFIVISFLIIIAVFFYNHPRFFNLDNIPNPEKNLPAALGSGSSDFVDLPPTVSQPESAVLETYIIRQALFAKKIRVWLDQVQVNITKNTAMAKAGDVTKAKAIVAKIDTYLISANALSVAWDQRITNIDNARIYYATAAAGLDSCIDQMALLVKNHKWIWN